MKKILSMLLTLAMVFSLAVPAMAAEDTRTIYFENTDNWSTVNAYAWDAESNALLGIWPGSAMTNVEGNIWSIEVSTDAVNMIFNNGSEKTGDLTIPTDGKNLYTYNIGWSTYGSTGDEPTINGNTEGEVKATFVPEIYLSGISITGDTVRYDSETNTYITVFPVGAESITHKTIYSGKNLAYYRDAGDRLKYREIGFKNGEQVGQWDTVLSEYNHFTYDEATGNLTLTGEPNAAIAGETWILSYSNDGGVTWQEACTQVYVQAYSITNSTAADANGSVTVPASAIEGETVTLTVTPEVGYELDELTVTYEDADGVTQNVIVTDNAFTMPAFAVTVTATFQQATETYTVTVDENIANGTVRADKTTGVTKGETVKLTVTPAEGYKLTNLTVTNTATGEPVTVSENNTFVMPDGNVTVTATFKKVYTIMTSTTGEVGGSTISVPASAAEGDIVTVTLNPAEGYTPLNFQVMEDVNVLEVPFTKVNETTYTFVMPAQNVRIEVDFCLPGTTLDAIYYKGTWTNVQFEFTNSANNYAGEVKGTMKETGIYEATPIPEWSYYLLIRNLDNEGEIISWIRIPNDKNMYNVETGQWETYTPSQPPEDVTSADINWGSMSFTYTDGEDGAEGAWSADTTEGAGTVTVENTGTTTVTVSAVYTPETAYAEITGTLGEEKTLAAAESGTFTLTLSGKPNKALNGEKIGTVTVTIE